MYNTDLPRRADLPTSAQLTRSTIIAGVSACAILVTVVLPSEYAVDPTGVGRLTGLTQMGENKMELAKEAAKDATASIPAAPATAKPVGGEALMRRLDDTEALLTAQRQQAAAPTAPAEEKTAVAATAPPAAKKTVPPSPVGRTDEVVVSLAPGQGAEVKLVMRQGARADFAWVSAGGVVNYDTHGDAPGQSTSYEKGRSVARGEGILEAAFDGNHGWFWRNRGKAKVTVTLRTNGHYTDIKRIL
jgi:hypothetical protein